MTSDDAGADEEDVDPGAVAREARSAALDAIAQIDDDADTLEVVEREEAIISTWVDYAVRAIDGGFQKSRLEAHAGVIASDTDHYTKQNIKDWLKDRLKEERQGGSGSGNAVMPLDTWVENHLDRVVVLETTDHTQDTLYRWDFTYDGGTNGTVETSRTKDGITHFSWSHFRDEIYEGLGVNTAKPNHQESEDWRLWLDELMDRKADHRETFGPRSHGVERLQDYVRDSMAFGNRADAAERGGVFTDADPSQGDPDELAVLSTEVKRICDDVEIEVRALQQELDARGHTHDDVAGVSDSFYINGSMVRFWLLDPEFATPAGYMDEAESPADAIDPDDDDDSGTPTPASADATGAGDGTQLSSIGPDSEAPSESEETSADGGQHPDDGDAGDAQDARSRTAAQSDSESDDGNTGESSTDDDS